MVCYLSAEFLLGPHLGTNLLNLGLADMCATRSQLGQDLDLVLEREEEPGLGNGGLGGSRPATWIRWQPCSFRPSVTASAMSLGFSTRRSATAGRPRARQMASPGNPWEIAAAGFDYCQLGGHTEHSSTKRRDARAGCHGGWSGGSPTIADPRLWRGHLQHPPAVGRQAVESFDFEAFNRGDY